MHEDAFFQVPRSRHETSAGEVELPIFYYDIDLIEAFFWCNLPAACRALDGTDLEPALRFASRCMVGFAAFDYRDTSIGPYGEVAIAIPVLRRNQPRPRFPWLDLLRPPDDRKVGFRVVELPVTTEAARAAGREIWGYPKFVTGIRVKLDGNQVDATVDDPGVGSEKPSTSHSRPSRTAPEKEASLAPDQTDIIASLGGRVGPGVAVPAISFVNFDTVEGRELRTTIDVRGPARLSLPGTVRLRVGQSGHPMAGLLRDMGLDGGRPFAMMTSERSQSRLPAGVEVT